MRKKLTCVLAAAFAAFACHAQLLLTLDDCLSIALRDNPTVKVADMEIERADYSKLETLSALLPQASFSGAYSRMLAKQVMYMNMSSFGGAQGGQDAEEGDDGEKAPQSSPLSRASGGGGIKVGLDNSYQVGFSASVPLIAPQLWASLKLSDSQILQSVEQARASRLSLVNEVKNAYFTLLLALDSRKVIQQSYDMAALTHEIYTKQYAAGAASDYDVLRTSVAMKNVEPELTQADIAIKQASLQLSILMGIDASQQIIPQDSLSRYQSDMYERAINLDGDYSGNSQLALNAIQTLQLEQALKVQKAAWYPTLSATASYSWTSMSNGSPFKNFRWNPYSMVGLQLNVPILTGGSRYSKIKQARVQLDQMRWQRENLERSVANQVTLARDNIRLNMQQIESTSQSVGQATRAHDIMAASFDIGAASYLDLRDSELALTQSRLAYFQSIFNYLVACSQLEYLQGSYVPAEPK